MVKTPAACWLLLVERHASLGEPARLSGSGILYVGNILNAQADRHPRVYVMSTSDNPCMRSSEEPPRSSQLGNKTRGRDGGDDPDMFVGHSRIAAPCPDTSRVCEMFATLWDNIANPVTVATGQTGPL